MAARLRAAMCQPADPSPPRPQPAGAQAEKLFEDLYAAFQPVVLRKATLAAAATHPACRHKADPGL